MAHDFEYLVDDKKEDDVPEHPHHGYVDKKVHYDPDSSEHVYLIYHIENRVQQTRTRSPRRDPQLALEHAIGQLAQHGSVANASPKSRRIE